MSSELGSYLAARRARLTPADVGLPAGRGRRVPGLRREEVALLAGVSVDYYSRLEQGREKSPSPSVLNALSRALELGRDESEYLFRVAGLGAADIPAAEPDAVDPDLLDLMGAWTHAPAMIVNRRLDLLALNDLARALYADFERAGNLVRMTFLDPVGRTFFADWPRAAEACVANLRLANGHGTLVAELVTASPEFARLWGRHDVRGKTLETKAFRHRAVGDLTLNLHTFDVRAAPGQQLVVYVPAPGSSDADKLRILGSLGAAPR